MAIGGSIAFYGNLIIILALGSILRPIILKFIPTFIVAFIIVFISYDFWSVILIKLFS